MTTRKERIVLDPTELATGGRSELDLHSGPIQVREGGVDWGQTEVEAFAAQHELGESPVDYRLPNRVITIPLVLGAEGDYDAARIALQAKVSRINEEGGWLKRELIGGSYGEAGSHLFCDLVKATLKYGGSTFAASNGVDPDAELVLEALPDFYGDPIEGSLFEGTGDAVATFQVKGNLPGRVDLAAYEESGKAQHGLAWAFRCRNYSAAASARLAYNATALKPLDQASVTALTGAHGGQAIGHSNLSTEWTPVLDNRVSGVYPTHLGLYDVWARVYTTSSEPPWMRMIYGVGDLIHPIENEPVRVPGAEDFYLVNLGRVNLRQVPVGPHRWIGVVQARTVDKVKKSVYVDRLWYLPADEGSGILQSRPSYKPGVGGFTARDDFRMGTEGPLTGRVADHGGTYVAFPGSDTTDFYVSTVARVITRGAVTDNGAMPGGWKGRAVGLPVGMGNTAFGYTFQIKEDSSGLAIGQMVRVAAADKYIAVYFVRSSGSGVPTGPRYWLPLVWKQKGGVGTLLYNNSFRSVVDFQSGTEVSARILTTVIGDQLTVLKAAPGTSNYEVILRLRDADLAGDLGTGDVYILDQHGGGGSCTRAYWGLAAWSPEPDGVLFANRNARLTSRGMFRQRSDGAAYGEVAYGASDLPRVPFSGPEGRPVEALVKPSRGNFGDLADNGIDKVAARLTYRPCWSNTPE